MDDKIIKFEHLGNGIFCGDFNRRVGTLSDYITESEQDPNFDMFYEISQNSNPRVSKDKIVNKYRRKLVETCISHNLQIVNGRCVLILKDPA